MPSAKFLMKMKETFGTSADYILTGEEPGQDKTADPGPAPEVKALLDQARDVLESEGLYADALSRNIVAFHLSVRSSSGRKPGSIKCPKCHRIIYRPVSKLSEDDRWTHCPFCGELLELDIDKIPEVKAALGEGLKQSDDLSDRSRKTRP